MSDEEDNGIVIDIDDGEEEEAEGMDYDLNDLNNVKILNQKFKKGKEKIKGKNLILHLMKKKDKRKIRSKSFEFNQYPI